LTDLTGMTAEQHAKREGHTFCVEMLQGRTSNFTYLDKVRASYDFTARDDNELTIRRGSVINVLWRHKSGWWIGECSGKTGLFPGNYTVSIPNSAPSSKSAEQAKDEENSGEVEGDPAQQQQDGKGSEELKDISSGADPSSSEDEDIDFGEDYDEFGNDEDEDDDDDDDDDDDEKNDKNDEDSSPSEGETVKTDSSEPLSSTTSTPVVESKDTQHVEKDAAVVDELNEENNGSQQSEEADKMKLSSEEDTTESSASAPLPPLPPEEEATSAPEAEVPSAAPESEMTTLQWLWSYVSWCSIQ